MLTIIAGEYRSRRLLSPPDERRSRPYLQRIKESVFNQLRGWFDGARVLDLFAGVGTMGLEAVSRGASAVVLVEQDRHIYEILRQNVEALGCGDRAETVRGDALAETALLRAPAPVDIVFLDPPYAMMEDEPSRGRVLAQAARCGSIMAERSFLVLRCPLGPDQIDLGIEGFEGPEAKRHRPDMWVLLYQPRRTL
jgi:16S rRNA (guanine966-N2)-methyltransferase